MNKLFLHLLIIYDQTNIHLHESLTTKRLVWKTVRVRKVKKYHLLKNSKQIFLQIFNNLHMLYHFFQANMLQKVILVFLLCVLQFQFYHSRYVLIDVYDKDIGPRGPGCGDFCISAIYPCTGDPKCPTCWSFECWPSDQN